MDKDLSRFKSIPRDKDDNIIFKIDMAVPTLDKEKDRIFIQDNSPWKTYINLKDAGIVLNSLVEVENKDSVNLLKIGAFYGFDVSIRTQRTENMGVDTYENKFYITGPDSNILLNHNNGTMPRTPELAGRYFIKALEKIEPLLDKHKGIARELKSDLAGIVAVDNTVFPKKDELMKVERELKNVVQRIEKNINQGKIPQMEM